MKWREYWQWLIFVVQLTGCILIVVWLVGISLVFLMLTIKAIGG